MRLRNTRVLSVLGRFPVGMFLVLLLALGPLCSREGRAEGAAAPKNHTMLMFVGEDLGMLSIASRREEAAWSAPAVAKVVNREEFLKKGRTTLAEVLELTPGFYMAPRESGTQPYLRGIPNSVLFLYDTINLGSDMSKTLHPLDYELSLAPIKRIEIIRGPGSVLWGPDAFAGVVNLVPLSGKDVNGVQVGVMGGAPDSRAGAYVNVGIDRGWGDGFFSITAREGQEERGSANVVRFFGDGQQTVAPWFRYGHENPGKGKYLDTYGRISLGPWITLSGKLSHYSKPYSVFEETGQFAWLEKRSTDWGYVKLEAQKRLAHDLGVRFTGSYERTEPETDIIDMSTTQSEKTGYLELVCDKGLWRGKGLLTGGISYRRKRVKNAPIWNAYFPEFLGPDNLAFLPQLTETDYSTRLFSLFGQYVHKVGSLDLVAGVRYDNHDPHKDHLSYNAGAVWSGGRDWVLKLFLGTAYRTPFSRQLLEEDTPDLEKITSICAQLSWKMNHRLHLGITGFRNRLYNHIMEDPYAGLSQANNQTITGVELEAKVAMGKGLTLEGNLTLLDNNGPDETYRLLDYVFISPEGDIVKHYKDIYYPYDLGPETLANVSAEWEPIDRITAFLRVGYASSYPLVAPRNHGEAEVDSAWVADGALTVKRFPFPNSQLEFEIKNLTNRHYSIPGIYSLRKAKGTSAEVWLRMNW